MTSNFFAFFNDRFRRAQNDALQARDRAVRANDLLKPRRLATEALEDRRLLSASAEYVDAMNSYSGFGGGYTAENFNAIEIAAADLSVETLQAAIDQAASTPENDAIFVVGGGTITFDPTVDKAFVVDFDRETQGELAIVGYEGTLQINANATDRAFVVKSGALLLGDVEIVDGNADFGGAIAIGEKGEVALDSVVLAGNQAFESGGAIANNGSLDVQNSLIVDNLAVNDGAAIYDGPFELASSDVEETAPEFVDAIANVEAKIGEIVQIDLSQYFSDGDWSYSFECSDENADSFAEAPTLDGSVLTLTFVGADAYSSSLDLSAVRFAVSAASPTDSTAVAFSNDFEVALADRATVVMQAVFSTLSAKKAAEQYAVYADDDEDEEYPLGYGAETIPESEVVDFSKSVYLQLWASDVASNWDVAVDCFVNLGCVVRVYNGELASPSGAFGQMGVQLLSETPGDGYVDYNISVLYNPETPSCFGVDSGVLFTAMKATPLDATQPISVELRPSPDVREPVASRLVAGAEEAVPVDNSQIAFFGAVSDGSSSDVAAAAPVVASATTNVSNVVFSGNVANGNGVVYVAQDRNFDVRHATFVDNFAEGAALYAVGGDAATNASALYNSIVVDNLDVNLDKLVATQNVPYYNNNLADAFESETAAQTGNVEYDATQPLFVDYDGADYRLAAGSQAIGIASVEHSVDVWFNPLATDVLGLPRDAAPDAGAYEFQVGSLTEAPTAPSDVLLSDYVQNAETGKWTTRLTWTDNSDNETKFVVAARLAGAETWREFELGANKTALKLGVDPNKDYVLRIWAENENGASEIVEFTFCGAQDVLNGLTVSTDAPVVGESLAATVAPTTGIATFQWFRVDAAGNETAIDGATDAVYVPTQADVDAYLKVVATGTNAVYASSVSAQTLGVVVAQEVEPGVPTAPSDVVLEKFDAEAQTLTIRWTDNADAVANFVVAVQANGSDIWAEFDVAASETSFTLSEIDPSADYVLRVWAENENGDASDYAEVAFNGSQDVLNGLTVSLDAPVVGESIAATVAPTTGIATFQWFRVDVAGNETAIDGATDAVYVPTQDDLGSFLKVVATGTNAAYVSSVSAQTFETVAAQEVEPGVPTAPTGLVFSDYNPATMTLSTSWTDNSKDETNFVVEYKIAGSEFGWRVAETLPADATGRVAKVVRPNFYYDFRVKAVNSFGESEYAYASFSAERDILTEVGFSTAKPIVGEEISAVLPSAEQEATFQWYRVDADGNETAIDGATDATYVPTVDDLGSRLKVVATSANAAYFSVVEATQKNEVGELKTAPAAPSDVVFGQYDRTTATLPMSWTDNSNDETQFVVEYRVDGGDWRVSAKLPTDVSHRVATVVRSTSVYDFRVKAVNSFGESDYAFATFFAARDILTGVDFTKDRPAVGEEISAVLTSENQSATFQWFRVDADGNETAIDGATDATYIPTVDDLGSFLKVVATNANSAYFSAVEAIGTNAVIETSRFAPAAPTDFRFERYDANAQTLQTYWTDNSTNETGFEVQYRPNGGDWLPAETLSANATERVATVVRDGWDYDFRIRAVNRFVDADGNVETLYSDWAEASFNSARDVLSAVEMSTNAPQIGVSIVATVAPTTAEATFQWYRVDADGNETAIDGATDATYVPTADDFGSRLKVVATSANAAYAANVFAQTTKNVDEYKTAPAAPSDVVFGQYDPTTATLPMSWTDNSNDETQFVVEYREDGSDWRVSAKLPTDVSYRVATVVRRTSVYEFRVKAVNSFGESDYAFATFFAAQDVLAGVGLSTENPNVGEAISAVLATETQIATFQWFRVDADGNETAIDGAFGATYVPTQDDFGSLLKVVATGANAAYFSQVSAVSQAVSETSAVAWTLAEYEVPAPISKAATSAAFAAFADDAQDADDATFAILAENARNDAENDPFADFFDEI